MRVYGIYAMLENKDAGTPRDQEQLQYLNGTFFEVTDINIFQSSTSIRLKGYGGSFNSVNFAFYKVGDGEFVSHNIFADPEINPYIRSSKT